MGRIERFENIEAWDAASKLTKRIYDLSNRGRFTKDFSLRDQLRRAVVSVMANIAEGYERGGDKEFQQFLSTAKASCAEVRSHLYVAFDQQYLTEPDFAALKRDSEKISRMLSGFIGYLRQSEFRGKKFKTFDASGPKAAPLSRGAK